MAIQSNLTALVDSCSGEYPTLPACLLAIQSEVIATLSSRKTRDQSSGPGDPCSRTPSTAVEELRADQSSRQRNVPLSCERQHSIPSASTSSDVPMSNTTSRPVASILRVSRQLASRTLLWVCSHIWNGPSSAPRRNLNSPSRSSTVAAPSETVNNASRLMAAQTRLLRGMQRQRNTSSA